MEVKINREIREYTEAMFFGLSMRQLFFSVLACCAAVAVYFLAKPVLGLETASWLCVISAVPFAAMGFIKYNGMTAEKFLMAWLRSEILMPPLLTFGNTNLYYAVLKEGTSGSGKKKRYHRKGARVKRKTREKEKRIERKDG